MLGVDIWVMADLYIEQLPVATSVKGDDTLPLEHLPGGATATQQVALAMLLAGERQEFSDEDVTLLDTVSVLVQTGTLTGDCTVTLPYTSDVGEHVVAVVDASGSCSATNTIIVAGAGATPETINGVPTFTISSPYGAVILRAHDGSWSTVGRQDAAGISVLDADEYFDGENVEDVFAEIGAAVDLYELPGVSYQLLYNVGVASFAPTTTPGNTLWSGTKHDFVNGDLAAGDRLQIVAHGFYKNDSGGNRSLSFTVRLDSTELVLIGMGGISDDATNINKGWRLVCDIFVDAIGVSGVLNVSAHGVVADQAFGLQLGVESQSAQYNAISLDLTDTWTLDITGYVDAGTSTQALECGGISVVKYNAVVGV